MIAVVVIPWWPGTEDADRYRWRDQVVALWRKRGYEVVTGLGFEGAARNAGIERAINEWNPEVIICTDADAIITAGAAEEAVALAADAPGLVVPHDRYVYLSEQACFGLTAELAAEILAGHHGRWPVVDVLTESVGPLSVGGPVVFSVETWRQAGGYDPTLVRAYDAAFSLACGTLVAEQRRLEGDFVHLWHKRPEPEPGEVWEIIREYHDAAKDGISAMASLVASRRVGGDG